MADRKKNHDYSSDESRENQMKTQAAIERELHDAKIRDYIDHFEEKN